MKIEVNGQVFDSVEDYEENYVVKDMSGDETSRWYEKKQKPAETSEVEQKTVQSQESSTQRQFTDEETRLYLASAMKSAFIVLGVMGAGILGFILFICIVW